MDIGSLTATLMLDSSKALAGMTNFERTMVALVSRIDSQLTLMSNAMLKVGASARIMGNEAAAAAGKVAAATKAASSAQPSRLFVAGSAGTSVVPMPATSAAPTVTPIVNEKPATASLERLNSSLAATAQKFRTFGYLASITLTAPIVLMSKAILNLEKDYEYTMQKIVGLTSATQRMTDGWSDSILKLAPQLGKGPKELAEGMYFVASAGFTGAKAMEMMTLSAKAAESGLGDTKDIAQFLTSALNAYSGTALTATKATDVLVAGVKYGKVEAAGFANAIGSVIPIASSMGVTLEQVVGTMAAMTLQGATAANAAVYLKGILNSILKIKPGNEAGKALEELGSSAIELRNMLGSGPNGVMDVLLKVQGWAKTNPYILNKVFGNIRSLTGDLSLVGNHLKENQKVINLVVNAFGDLDYAVSAVSGTLKVRMDKAMAGLQSGIIKFGDTISKYIMPIIEGFVSLLNKLMAWFTNLSEPMKKLILGFIAFAAAVGPLSLLLSLHMYVVDGLTKAYGRLTAVITAERIAVLGAASPYILLATVIGAVGAMIYKLAKTTEPLKNMYKELNTETAKEVFSLNSLFDKLNSTTQGTKDRKESLALINGVYGEYLPNLLTEKSSLQDIAEAQKAANDALVANIAVKKYSEELEKQRGSIATATEDYFGDIMSAWSNTFGAGRLGEFTSALNKAVNDALKAGMEKNAEGGWKSHDVFKKFYDEYIYKMAVFTKDNDLAFAPVNMAFGQLLQKIGPARTIIDDLNAKVKAFGGSGVTAIQEVTNGFTPLTEVEEENAKATERLAEAWRNAGNAIHQTSLLMAMGRAKGLSQDMWTMLFPSKEKNVLTGNISTGLLDRNKDGGFKIPEYSLGATKPYEFMPSMRGEYTETAAVMKTLGDELEFINMKEQALGITMGKRKELFDAARAKTNAYSKALEDYLAIPISQRGASWQEEVNKTIVALETMQSEFDKIQTRRDFLNGITDTFSSFFMNIMSGTQSVANSFKEMVNSIIQSFEKLLAETVAKKIGNFLLNLIFPGASAATNLVGSFLGGNGNLIQRLIPTHANGTMNAPGGLSLVGERGPELVNLPRGSQVFPSGMMGMGRQIIEFEPVEISIKENTMTGFLKKANTRKSLY